jgi:hypothetical protein
VCFGWDAAPALGGEEGGGEGFFGVDDFSGGDATLEGLDEGAG